MQSDDNTKEFMIYIKIFVFLVIIIDICTYQGTLLLGVVFWMFLGKRYSDHIMTMFLLLFMCHQQTLLNIDYYELKLDRQ